MTYLLSTILADPELRQWPQHAAPAADPASRPYPAAAIPAPQSPEAPPQAAPAAGEMAAERIRSNINDPAPAAPQTSDPEFNPLGFAEPPQDPEIASAAERTADQLPPSVDAADDQPRNEPEPTDNENAISAPLAFDDIATKPNSLLSAINTAGAWLKDRDWKDPRTLGAAAAVLIAVSSIGYWALGDSAGDQAPTAQMAPTSSSTQTSPTSAPAQRDTVIPVSTATARCPAPSSDPMNAFRLESAQPWICIMAYSIAGQVLTVTFDKAYVITSVGTLPGANSEEAGKDQWAMYRTVRLLNWSFNDVGNTSCDQDTHNIRKIVPLAVTAANCYHKGPWQPVVASAVTITIQKTDQPSNPGSVGPHAADAASTADYTAFAISRLQLLGHPVTG